MNWTEGAGSTTGPKSDSDMVTVLESSPKKSDTPDRPQSGHEDDRKSPAKAETDGKHPRIRLKAALATDPALNMLGKLKTEVCVKNFKFYSLYFA